VHRPEQEMWCLGNAEMVLPLALGYDDRFLDLISRQQRSNDAHVLNGPKVTRLVGMCSVPCLFNQQALLTLD
jgi:hypothetical protein